MKRVFTIFLSLLLLNGTTELHQLWKLPLLARHYQQHRREDPSLRFFAFLKLHYTNQTDHTDKDDNKDNELPFKSAALIAHTDIPVIVKKDIPSFLLTNENTTTNICHPEGIPCHRAYPVFHPPRIS